MTNIDKLYNFVLVSKHNDSKKWCLKINNEAELQDFYTNDTRGNTVLLEYSERKHYSMLTSSIVLYSENNGLSIIDGIRQFFADVYKQQLDFIHKFGSIYINENSSYIWNTNEYTEHKYIIKNVFEFPTIDDSLTVSSVDTINTYKKQDMRFGFIDTQGNFYEGAWSTHAELAIQIIKQFNYTLDNVNEQNAAILYLINEKGFVLVHNPSMISDTIVVKKNSITNEQRNCLYNLFINSGNVWQADEYIT